MGSNQNKNFVERRGRFIFAEMIKNLHLPNPSTYYEFLEMLGEGCYSEVHQVRLRETGQIRAIKKVQTANNPFLDRHLTNEFDILRRLVSCNSFRITPIS
jgi:serine/threonine protein kinase